MDTGDAAAETTERWLPVAGWEGWYEVGSLGNIRPVRRGLGTHAAPLHPTRHANGSLCISLRREGRSRQAMVHHLVAAAFLDPCPAFHRLDWRNDNHTDNRASNLFYRPKRRAPLPPGTRRGPHRSFDDGQVREVRRLLATMGVSAVARRFNVTPATISRIKNGQTYRGVADDPMEPEPQGD